MWGIALRLVGLAATAYLVSSCGDENSEEEKPDAGPHRSTEPIPDAGKSQSANRPPQCGDNQDIYVNAGETASRQLQASDPDGDNLTYNPIFLPQGASLSASGLFSWRPGSDQASVNNIIFGVSDGSTSESCTVVVHVNHSPVLNLIPNKTIQEGESLTFQVSASDPDGTTPSLSGGSFPIGASFNSTGTFQWTPGYNQAGNYSVEFYASDGELTASQTVNIQVQNTNQSPIFAPIPDKTVHEGELLSFQVSASDPDGTTPILSSGPLPSGATFNPSTGMFQWTPNLTQSGSYSVVFTATDGEATTPKTVNIQVQNTNQSPVLTPIPNKTIQEGESFISSHSIRS